MVDALASVRGQGTETGSEIEQGLMTATLSSFRHSEPRQWQKSFRRNGVKRKNQMDARIGCPTCHIIL